MTDAVEIFLGDVKCTVQRFNPQPGDLFVISYLGEKPEETMTRIIELWEKYVPGTRAAFLIGGMTVDHVERAGAT